MNNLGFSYIHTHDVWLHEPTSSLIFLHELFTKTDEEIKYMVFDRTGENPSDWLISYLKNPYEEMYS